MSSAPDAPKRKLEDVVDDPSAGASEGRAADDASTEREVPASEAENPGEKISSAADASPDAPHVVPTEGARASVSVEELLESHLESTRVHRRGALAWAFFPSALFHPALPEPSGDSVVVAAEKNGDDDVAELKPGVFGATATKEGAKYVTCVACHPNGIAAEDAARLWRGKQTGVFKYHWRTGQRSITEHVANNHATLVAELEDAKRVYLAKNGGSEMGGLGGGSAAKFGVGTGAAHHANGGGGFSGGSSSGSGGGGARGAGGGRGKNKKHKKNVLNVERGADALAALSNGGTILGGLFPADRATSRGGVSNVALELLDGVLGGPAAATTTDSIAVGLSAFLQNSAAANALSSGRDSFGGIALEAAPPVGGGVDRPRIIDLRSDTVTKPTQTMRAAMATAICGDDVFGDDPTVKDLEIVVAAAFGKEAALFVPSGTMGNLIAVGVHCEVRGSEFICGDLSHVHIYEQGGLSTLMGAHPRALKNEDDGTIDLQRIRNAFRSDDQHFPRTTVLCIEQTHNKKGGRVLPLSYVDDCGALCKSLGIQLHVDGARIWNAAIAQGVTPARAVQAADSVSVCLSKGLGAPVGSVIVGSAPFIAKCRRLRKACGGGMRQAGTLAAAAMMALREVWPVMSLDHVRMKRLAAGLQKIPGVEVSSPIETNICFVTFPPTADVGDVVVALKREHEIVVIPWTTPNSIRIVTHHEINDAAVQAVVDGVTRVLANMYRGGR